MMASAKQAGVTHAWGVTSVGLSLEEIAISVRSGVARFADVEWLDRALEPFVVASVPDAALPDVAEFEAERGLTYRAARTLRLALAALKEAAAVLQALPAPPPLFLALPMPPAGRDFDGAAWVDAFSQQLRGQVGDVTLVGQGRAAGVTAVAEACRQVAAGEVPHVLVGGVDSYRDLYLLGALDADARVKSSQNMDGFIPGEGAGFLLISETGVAAVERRPVMARVVATGSAVEAGHLHSEEPYRGDGLSAALASLQDAEAEVGTALRAYSTMNGESHWIKEWGVACMRHRELLADCALLHPAESYGDAGAASGVLAVALAAHDLVEAAPGTCSLVYGSSDHGERSAALLESAG